MSTRLHKVVSFKRVPFIILNFISIGNDAGRKGKKAPRWSWPAYLPASVFIVRHAQSIRQILKYQEPRMRQPDVEDQKLC